MKSSHDKSWFRFSSVAGAVSLMAACGGSAPAADAPEGEAASEEGVPEGAETAAEDGEATVRFDEMSRMEKMKHMKTVVAPTMAKVFQEADEEEYADFGCANCHGPGAKNGEFEMPSDALPKLNLAEIDWEAPVPKFMSERVVPEMAKLLGEEPYNPETQEGFGCMDCHQAAE